MATKFWISAILGLTISVTFTTTGFGATELARVNGVVISLEEFNEKYRENAQFFQGATPSKKEVLDDLIKRKIGIQEAMKAGLHNDPEIKDRMDTVLFHALLEKNLSKEFEQIHISDDEARKYYKRYPTLRTSQIYVAVSPAATAVQKRQAYEKIKKIQVRQLRNGKKTFAEIAQTYSEGPTAPLGGDTDYMDRDRTNPTYYDAALKLRSPGKVSDIIKTPFGYHIIKLTAIRPWAEVDKTSVKRLVFEERRAKVFDHYMASLRKKASVSINSNLIKN